MNPNLHGAFLSKAGGQAQRNTRTTDCGTAMSRRNNGTTQRSSLQLDHINGPAVRASVGLFARRRQRAGKILVTAPALDPEWTRASPRFVVLFRFGVGPSFRRELQLADFVRRDIPIRLLSENVVAFCHCHLPWFSVGCTARDAIGNFQMRTNPDRTLANETGAVSSAVPRGLPL